MLVFVVIDEVDFILVDEVRILLIIFGEVEKLIILYVCVNIFVCIFIEEEDYIVDIKIKFV